MKFGNYFVVVVVCAIGVLEMPTAELSAQVMRDVALPSSVDEPFETASPSEAKRWLVERFSSNSLSKREREAIYVFKKSGTIFNNVLRGRRSYPGRATWASMSYNYVDKRKAAEAKYGISNFNFSSLENFKTAVDGAISKTRLDRPVVVYRGFGRPGVPDISVLVGKTMTDPAYLSTALLEGMAFRYAHQSGVFGSSKRQAFLARITIPAGSCVTSPQTYLGAKGTDSDAELILPRKTELKVTKVGADITRKEISDSVDKVFTAPKYKTKENQTALEEGKKIVDEKISKLGGLHRIDATANTPCGQRGTP